MNFQKIRIQILLNLDSIKIVDNIQKDKRFVEWNQLPLEKRNLIFREVDLYKDPNFRMNMNFNFDQEEQQIRENDQNDNDTESQATQYKTKKISKVDKYHIKEQKDNNNKDAQINTSRIQQKRRKQLEAHQKKYRIQTKSSKQTGKKQPKQLDTSRQSVSKNKKKHKPTPGIRNNSHINQSSLSANRRKNVQQSLSQAYSSIQEEQSSFSQDMGYSKSKSKSKTKSKPKKGSSSSKHHRSESNKKETKIPQKMRYLLQNGSNKAQLEQKFTKQVLSQVPGRKQEAKKIFDLIIHAQNGSSSSISLHGNTGCGKTSLITKMLNFIMRECSDNFSTAYLNCMSMWSVNHVYSGILYKLFGMKQKKSQRALNSLFQCSKQLANTTKLIDSSKDLSTQIQKTKIIVLDEIDHFIKDQTFFYNLLEWTHIKNSKIVLIMISNVLDLTVKLSAKIQSRMKFESIIFRPYSADAIQQIMKYKYPEAVKIFESKSIQFLCKKIVSINSDIRLLQKTYEDVIAQWSEANGLVYPDDNERENNQYSGNMDLQQENEQSHNSKQSHQNNQPKILPQNNRQRKQLIDRLLRLSRTKRIKIEDVHKSLFLTGQMCNDQLPQIMKQYQILLQVLHKARRKQDVSYQIMNKMFMMHQKLPSSQQVFLQMCELKDMGLVQFKENTRNCDVIFQGFGIKVNPQLHLMCPEE